MEKILSKKDVSTYKNAMKIIYGTVDEEVEEYDMQVFDKYGNYYFPTETNLIEPNVINGMMLL